MKPIENDANVQWKGVPCCMFHILNQLKENYKLWYERPVLKVFGLF